MSNKKEPLKDLFYNAFDYIIMLAIILVVTSIIAWRLDLLFADTNNNISKADDYKENTESNIDEDKKTKEKVKSLNEQIDKDKVDDKDKEKDKSNDKSDENKKSSSIIAIEIPEGSHSAAIAEILKSKGIIDENDEFISKVEDMNVSTKLRSGYFEVNEDDSLEDVINTIIK